MFEKHYYILTNKQSLILIMVSGAELKLSLNSLF